MNILADKIIRITAEYIGPAAQRFLERQASHISGLTMDNIERKHLSDLSTWVQISGKLLLDGDRATELAKKIERA